jgi:hypothetical protein
MSYWTIPRIWEGKTCVILGGGPSLDEVDFSLLEGLKVIAVNDVYKDEETREIRKGIDCVYWKDKCWYDQLAFKDYPELGPNRFILTMFKGLKVTSCENYLEDLDVLVLRRGRRQRLERDPEFITHSNNAGAEALALSTMLGCKMVLLLGFDMKTVNGRHNYHENHVREIPENIYDDYFIGAFEVLSRDLEEIGVRVINCTPNSALKVFPIVPLEEVINAERGVCP